MADDLPVVGHPTQQKEKQGYDLADPKAGHGILKDQRNKDEGRSPAVIMREMGFDPTKNMTPLQFMVAVMNDDLDLIFKDEKRRTRTRAKGGLALAYRLEAAKAAMKYFHTPPADKGVDDGGFADKLAERLASGNVRISERSIILEQIEQIAPDVPLPAASYPAAFAPSAAVIDIEDGDPIDADTTEMIEDDDGEPQFIGGDDDDE